MHPRIHASRPEAVRRVLPWLAALACCLTLEARATDYLRHVAPPPLREIEPAPPPAEIPMATPAVEEVSAPKEAGTPVIVAQPTEATPTATQPAPASAPDNPVVTAPPAPTPPPVLQDPLRERVTLEDLLPFFAPPHGSGSSGSQPLSSATYRRE